MTNRMTTRLDEPATAECFDDALRWLIPSRTDPNVSYLVELNSAPGYDVCQCAWFVTTLGPILKQGITPEEAVAQKLVKIKKHERVEDALKCWHAREANYRYGATCKRLMCRRRARELSALKQGNQRIYDPAPQTTPPEDSAQAGELPPIRRSDLVPEAEDLGPSPGL